ncbi:hypothetical protein BDZ97DRAFT_1066592 [Flammula alnicola]|nr:hypothetical protein BDZ97DRAFT_1066592 [Flammula alnicola]
MAMTCKHQLRYNRPMCSPKGDAVSFPLYSFPQRHQKPVQQKDERRALRFVLVDDTLFKVPEGFFQQMPLEIQEFVKFSSGLGSKPEAPIRLVGHTNDQFKQILTAYNAYPSLDVHALTLDHLLTIGELSLRYGLRDLARWFLPAFKATVTSHRTPLRTASNYVYVRTLKLAIGYRSAELCSSIQSKWVTRMYWGELRPLAGMLLADMYGMRDLLGHTYYVYLMMAEPRMRSGPGLDESGGLNSKQRTHILAGYYSLRTYWRQLQEHPPEFEAATECTSHLQCVRVWKIRWTTMLGRPCPLPEVDVLGRLVFMERSLRDDILLEGCLTPPCKALALQAVSAKREQVSRHLHHHFDL